MKNLYIISNHGTTCGVFIMESGRSAPVPPAPGAGGLGTVAFNLLHFHADLATANALHLDFQRDWLAGAPQTMTLTERELNEWIEAKRLGAVAITCARRD